MADISDVENALVSTIAAIVYPNGTAQPSITGVPTIIYPGWPQSSQLDLDMAAFATGVGRLHVTVFPTNTEKNTTRYFTDFQEVTTPAPTLTITVAGQAVTLAGTVSTPQNVALIINDLPYTYEVQVGDTLTTIASALAALVSGATSAGAVVTIPVTGRIAAARTGTVGTVARITRSQQRTIQITVWADTPDHRSATASAIDSALSAMNFIVFPDGSQGRLVYVASHIDDMTQKANVFRRDLLYSVDFATTVTASATEVIVTEENTQLTMPDGTNQPISTVYQ